MSISHSLQNQAKSSKVVASREKIGKAMLNKKLITKVFATLGATSDFPISLVKNKHVQIAIQSIVDSLYPSTKIVIPFPCRETVRKEMVKTIKLQNDQYLSSFREMLKSQTSPAIAYTNDSTTSKSMHPELETEFKKRSRTRPLDPRWAVHFDPVPNPIKDAKHALCIDCKQPIYLGNPARITDAMINFTKHFCLHYDDNKANVRDVPLHSASQKVNKISNEE